MTLRHRGLVFVSMRWRVNYRRYLKIRYWLTPAGEEEVLGV